LSASSKAGHMRLAFLKAVHPRAVLTCLFSGNRVANKGAKGPVAQEDPGPTFGGGAMANQSLNNPLQTSMVLVETSRMLVPWASRALASAYPIMPISWNARPRWWYPSCHVGDSCTAVLTGAAGGRGGGSHAEPVCKGTWPMRQEPGRGGGPDPCPEKLGSLPTPPPLPPVEPRGPVGTWRRGGPRGRS